MLEISFKYQQQDVLQLRNYSNSLLLLQLCNLLRIFYCTILCEVGSADEWLNDSINKSIKVPIAVTIT